MHSPSFTVICTLTPPSSCCNTRFVLKDVGAIPKGKWNVKIRLSASADVDVQIYDTEDVAKFEEGKAIIAYCEAKGCNKGALGNNEGEEESTVHSGMAVGYSG